VIGAKIYHFDTSDLRKLQGYIFHISLWSLTRGIYFDIFLTTRLIALMQADSLLSWGRLIAC